MNHLQLSKKKSRRLQLKVLEGQRSIGSRNQLTVSTYTLEETNRDQQKPTGKSMSKAGRMAWAIHFAEHEFPALQSNRLGFISGFDKTA